LLSALISVKFNIKKILTRSFASRFSLIFAKLF
jgi:hypothetical protein